MMWNTKSDVPSCSLFPPFKSKFHMKFYDYGILPGLNMETGIDVVFILLCKAM